MTSPLASSVYRLADSEVLIAVAQTPDGPAPLFADVGGEVACVAYTDLREAQGDAPVTRPLLVLALDDLPSEHRQWLLANTPPFYERQR